MHSQVPDIVTSTFDHAILPVWTHADYCNSPVLFQLLDNLKAMSQDDELAREVGHLHDAVARQYPANQVPSHVGDLIEYHRENGFTDARHFLIALREVYRTILDTSAQVAAVS